MFVRCSRIRTATPKADVGEKGQGLKRTPDRLLQTPQKEYNTS